VTTGNAQRIKDKLHGPEQREGRVVSVSSDC
jgi:hypothetical protein